VITNRGGNGAWRVGNVPLPQPHLFAIAAGVWLHRVRPWHLRGRRSVHQLIGWPLLAAGTYIIARSLQAAARVHLEHPDRLVTSGPYALSRNPMYLGWALLHLGAGVAGGSGWTAATLPAAVLVVHRQVLHEEAELGERFTDEFRRYEAAVPRHLPRMGMLSRPSP
jgi:protein-S-isoprenylcysteine O-methyltransferase Ste14